MNYFQLLVLRKAKKVHKWDVKELIRSKKAFSVIFFEFIIRIIKHSPYKLKIVSATIIRAFEVQFTISS